jgi:hypothetical protein
MTRSTGGARGFFLERDEDSSLYNSRRGDGGLKPQPYIMYIVNMEMIVTVILE